MRDARPLATRTRIILLAITTPLSLCAVACVYFYLTHAPRHVMTLNVTDCDSFISQYFPSALNKDASPTANVVAIIEEPLTLKVRGRYGACAIDCDLATISRTSDGKYRLHCGADPIQNDDAIRLGVQLCEAIGLPSDRITGWYAKRGVEKLEQPSCLQTGVVDGHACSVELRGTTVDSTIYIFFEFDL